MVGRWGGASERRRRAARATVVAAVVAALAVVPAGPLSGTAQAAASPARLGAAAADSGRRIVQAARWPLSKADTDFYKIVLLPDGYPGKKVDGQVVPHPIYGVYLVRAFRRAYLQDGRESDRLALHTVAWAAVHRMGTFHGTLAFWYEPGRSVPLPRAPYRAYSALTQAYYAQALTEAAMTLEEPELRTAADAVFRSLLVPTSRGGVLSPGAVGPVLEEEPTTVPSAILNGWLSALAAVRAYARLTGSEPARELLRTSVLELARRLPRYDVPQVLGSSYSALTSVTLRLDVPVGTVVRSAALVVDGRAIALTLRGPSPRSDAVGVLACGRRTGGTVVVTCSGLQLDVPVSGGGTAGTSTVKLALHAPGHALVRGSILRARYRFVHDRGRRVIGWGSRSGIRGGARARTVALPVSAAQLRAAQTPTTFKLYGGHRVNVYHRAHVNRLAELARDGGRAFATWSARWRDATCRWRDHAAYVLIPRGDLGCIPVPTVPPAAASGPATADAGGEGSGGRALATVPGEDGGVTGP